MNHKSDHWDLSFYFKDTRALQESDCCVELHQAEEARELPQDELVCVAYWSFVDSDEVEGVSEKRHQDSNRNEEDWVDEDGLIIDLISSDMVLCAVLVWDECVEGPVQPEEDSID